MISIVVDNATSKEYFADILDIYKENVFLEFKNYKEVKFNKKLKKALYFWYEKDYIKAKKSFYEVLEEIQKKRILVDKYMISMLENNLANCYVKLQDQEEYKNYYLLEMAEAFYRKAIYHAKYLTKPKGIIFFNYAFFCLKLNLWKEDQSLIQMAQNNAKLMQRINQFVYTKGRSLSMYKFFIVSKKYKFYSDFNDKILMNFGDRIF